MDAHAGAQYAVGPTSAAPRRSRRPSPARYCLAVATPELSYCVVNTSQRELLIRGLDAIGRERAGLPFAAEVLVLDNGSRDGSAEAALAHPAVTRRSPLPRTARQGAERLAICCAGRRGASRCSSTRTPSCCPGRRWRCGRRSSATAAAACAGARLLRPDGAPQASAWRFPTPLTALAGALFLHRLLTVQSRGPRTQGGRLVPVGGAARAARAAAEVGYLDPDFFVYSDEVDFARRLRDAGWRSLYVPAAHGRPPRAALHRRGPREADRRARAQQGPVHAQASRRGRRTGGALADRLGLRGQGAGRARAARPLAARYCAT